ncbi:Leukocyte antigen CD37 [Orchesella cincta]|uniref:Leukocyte antigen CD37 n=1 Tax=Orchesella cincta TaxID=48709 RepID=A0A1D2MDX9_ORCCI|nr:Leukocyte antigen CD37 [Orchesella cincta]
MSPGADGYLQHVFEQINTQLTSADPDTQDQNMHKSCCCSTLKSSDEVVQFLLIVICCSIIYWLSSSGLYVANFSATGGTGSGGKSIIVSFVSSLEMETMNVDDDGGAGVHEEEVKFLSPVTTPMLPPEIWEKIIGNLEAQDDICAVINTCVEWSELLASKKLPLGLPILLVNRGTSLDAVLVYRQLNRKIREVVDKQLQKYSTFPEEDFSSHLCACRRNAISKLEKLNWRYFFWHSSDTKRFIKTFRLKNRSAKYNPFITRSITLKHNGLGVEHFRTFLDCCGHHVHHITFVPVWAPGNLTELLSLLHLVPNIRTLKIDGDLYLQTERDFLRSSIFPPLSHLTALDFSVSLFHAENLRVDWFHTENLSSLLPSLKNLRIIGVTSTSVALTELAQVNWPLERLQLWDLGESTSTVEMETVLRLVQKFGNTLTQIGQSGSKVKTSHNYGALLCHVKSLSIYRSTFSNTTCWTYFQEIFGNVEELTIFEPAAQPISSKSENNAMAKKCFEALPKLKTVTVTFSPRRNKEPIVMTRCDVFRLDLDFRETDVAPRNFGTEITVSTSVA